MVDVENCIGCKFWLEVKEGITEDAKKELGVCRRYPPTIIQVTQDSYSPVVFSDSWCGEYNRKKLDS